MIAAAVAAQKPTPTFEVASVKGNKSDDDVSKRNLGAGGRMVFEKIEGSEVEFRSVGLHARLEARTRLRGSGL